MGLLSRHAAPRLVIPKLVFNIASVSAVAAPATRSYRGTTSDTTSQTTYTFTNHDIGTASATRYVVVCVMASDATVDRTLSSVTIGGNNAAQHEFEKSTSVAIDMYTAIYGLTVTSGTTATIVVTWSGGMTGCHVAVFALDNLTSTTPHATNGNNTGAGTASSVSTTMNIPSNGVGIAIAGAVNNNAAHTPTGLSEDNDASVDGNVRIHVMSDQSMSSETGRTITSTGTANTSRAISVASWS
jgi:hypothetical protein